MNNLLSTLPLLANANQLKQAAHQLHSDLCNNPTEHEGWLKLAELANKAGLTQLQHHAQKQYELVAYFNHRLHLANQALLTQKFDQCQQVLDALLADVPGEFRALALYAELAIARGDNETATEIFETLHRHNFNNLKTKHRAIQHMANAKQFNKALQIGRTLQQQQILETPETALAMAHSYLKLAQLEKAEHIFLQLLDQGQPKLLVMHWLGHIKAFTGNTQAAARWYQQALTVYPEKTESYWHLANLKTYRFSEPEAKQMLELLQSPLEEQERMYLCFAVAKMKEQQQHLTESCSYYAQANQLRYKAGRNVKVHDSLALRHYFSTQPLPKQTTAPSGLIFILGMPRTGSTLLEQMLSSHPEIDASYELSEISAIARNLESRKQDNSPYGLAHLDSKQRNALAKRYLDYVAPLRQQGRYC